MHQDCPVCFEYLFESRNDVIPLPCGHTIHKTCMEEMQEHYKYSCPFCSKLVCDMSKVWEKFDMEIASDCGNKMKVVSRAPKRKKQNCGMFGKLGHKSSTCEKKSRVADSKNAKKRKLLDDNYIPLNSKDVNINDYGYEHLEAQ